MAKLLHRGLTLPSQGHCPAEHTQDRPEAVPVLCSSAKKMRPRGVPNTHPDDAVTAATPRRPARVGRRRSWAAPNASFPLRASTRTAKPYTPELPHTPGAGYQPSPEDRPHNRGVPFGTPTGSRHTGPRHAFVGCPSRCCPGKISPK
ncbi:hypothetical protein PCASD_01699 [Puccinia coronata f. sp. avenae]|uniref:Uncharacterized protein n=1 Tax=Puccinia coronata f. sp. avenae TaxID=200324 RepID=A0A2N5VK32_9BASI|nr:hypothetical protein PCASD_01699 [Puccinia coronata f. sp. avenae]